MDKHWIIHFYINLELQNTNNENSTFHFSSIGIDEKQIMNIAELCSRLLKQVGIKHEIKFVYEPTDERGTYNDSNND